MITIGIATTFQDIGSGGSASHSAAAACPDDPSLILLGAGLFSLSISQWRILHLVPRGGATLTDFLKIGFAVQFEAKQV